MRIIIFTISMLAFASGIFSQQELPKFRNGMFAASGNCAFCHNGLSGANTYKDKDISQSNLWRSTMMANANRDQFWRAKVDAEALSVKSEVLKKAATDLCLKCHAPMGFTQSVNDGVSENYNIDKIDTDMLAFDGVSCMICHQIQPDNFGKPESFSGNYKINKDKKIFGPYNDIRTDVAGIHSEFKPVFGEHLKKSELCATCHTVITPHLNNKEEIDGVFFEQTAYLEWKNSQYYESGINCQSCHMPSVSGSIDIASMPPNDTTKRSPVFPHQFVGGNEMMENIFIKNNNELKLSSGSIYYEDKLKETESNLKENALGLSANTELKGTDLIVYLKLENQAGHKLPTGIPFRRMWIHFTVKDKEGNVVFESGNYDASGNIYADKESIGKHYDEITNPGQVQIYQAIMADLKGNYTFSLLKADKYVKDNRIPPAGFTTQHASYDTTKIYGNALSDNNFNKDANGNEGSGSDIVTYKISNVIAGFTVNAEVLYQTMDPLMLEYLKSYESPAISTFISMYNKSDIKPIVMKSLTLTVK